MRTCLDCPTPVTGKAKRCKNCIRLRKIAAHRAWAKETYKSTNSKAWVAETQNAIGKTAKKKRTVPQEILPTRIIYVGRVS